MVSERNQFDAVVVERRYVPGVPVDAMYLTQDPSWQLEGDDSWQVVHAALGTPLCLHIESQEDAARICREVWRTMPAIRRWLFRSRFRFAVHLALGRGLRWLLLAYGVQGTKRAQQRLKSDSVSCVTQ